MKKKFLKALSLLLAVMLVFSATVAIIPASAEEAAAVAAENLVTNGDFETGDTTGWYWSYGVTTDYVYDGNYSYIVNDGTGYWKNTFQCVNVEPYTDYEFSFWYYAPLGGDYRTLWYVNGAPANVDKANPTAYFETVDSTLAKGSYTQSEEGVWTQVTATVNSSVYDVLVIDYYSNAGDDSTDVQLYIDNVSLTVVPNADNGNAVKNGGFEEQRTNWGSQWYGLGDIDAARIVTDTVYEGTYAATVASGYNQFIYTKIDCKSNTDYVLEFYTINASGVSYAISSNLDVNNTGSFRDDANTPEGTILKKSISNTTSWDLNRIEFNSGESTSLYIAFYNRGNGAGTIRIDNVSVKESAYNNDIFKNGDFENGTIQADGNFDRATNTTDIYSWYRPEGDTYNGNNTITGTTDLAYTGKRSLKIDTDKSGQYYAGIKLYKNFAVEKNTDYYISYYYNIKAAGDSTIYSVVGATDCTANDSGTVLTRLINTTAATDGWVKVSATFNSGENEMLRLVFRTKGLSSELEMYVDDIVVTEFDNGKLVKNGGFEYDANKWTLNGDGTVSTAEHYEGSASAKLPTAQYNKVFQQVTLEANTDYVASFYYKGSGYFKWGISTGNSPDNKIGTAGGGLWGTTEWTNVRVLFNTGDNTSLYFTFMSGGNDIDIYIDNASIIPDPNPEDGLIVNGGFEIDTYNWSTGGGTVVAEDDGNSAFKLSTTNYNKMNQTFTVKPNTNYMVSFYYKGTASWMNKWGVSVDGGVEPSGRLTGGNLSTVTEWTKTTQYFNSGDNTTLYFAVMSGSGADMLIDNVCIVLDPNPEDGLVVNGGFENGDDKWSTGGGEISTDEYYDGSASFKLSTTVYNKVSQQITVEANTDYVVSYWYKGNSYSRWGVGTTTGVEKDQRIAGGDIYSTNGEWVRAYAFFNSGENTSLYFSLMSGGNDIEVYIDNVSVAAVEAGDANGDGLKNATDLTVLKQVILGTTVTHSTAGCKVRGEDSIDVRDLIRLKKELSVTAE